MSTEQVVMIGFGRMVLTHLDGLLPPRSVVAIEDPDVIVKRDVGNVTDLRCLAAVVPGRYHQDTECVDVAVARFGAGRARAVIPGVEYAVPGAAALAERWGLPGAGTAAAAVLTDKLRLREAAAGAGLRNPRWREVHGPGDVRAVAAGGRVVLKPANRHASLGVQLLDPGDNLDEAWAATVGATDGMMLPDRPLHWRYLAEDLVEGHEYSVEAIVSAGRITFLNVTDKLTAGGRHPVELGHVVPAPLPDGVRDGFVAAMESLIAAVGFGSGILHAEWMLGDEGPVLIECAGRIPGDSIIDLINTAYGSDLVRGMLRALTGEDPAMPAEPRRASAIRFLRATPGLVEDVRGVEAARTEPGVIRAQASVAAGDTVGDLVSSWDRVGEVVALGPTPAAAVKRAEHACSLIDVVTRAPAP